MKKLVIAMLAIAAFTFSANAQQHRQMKQQNPRHQKAMMLKSLNFSPAQKEQLKASREVTKKQMADLNKNENITVKEFKARKAAIQKTQKEQFEKVLTPEQKNQLAQNKTDRKARQEMKAAKRMDKMKVNLNLSDEQVNKLKANREASQAKATAIRENGQLSQSEKKEQMIALRKTQKNSFKEVLSPEQITKMEQKKKDRMDKPGKK